MMAETAWASRASAAKKYFYYKCPKYRRGGTEACPNKIGYRAEKVESLVWGFVSDLLKDLRGYATGLRR
jgi:hypothetical protein